MTCTSPYLIIAALAKTLTALETFFWHWASHVVIRWRELQSETSIYFTYHIKMSKRLYLFQKAMMGGLEDNIVFTLWDHIEAWTSQNVWMPILFILNFLGVIFKIVRIHICTWFQKKLALPEKKSSEAEKVRKKMVDFLLSCFSKLHIRIT